MKGFYVMPSYAEAIISLPERYGREAAIAVIRYGATGELPDKMSEVVKAVLMLIMPIIDRAELNIRNGKLGGRPAKMQTSESEDMQKNEKGGFPLPPTPPIPGNKELRQGIDIKQTAPAKNECNCEGEKITLERVLAIADSEKIDKSEAERFYNYYKSQGWLFSNGRRVTDIPSALRRWNKSRFVNEEKRFKNERKLTKEQIDAFLGDPDDFDAL